MLVTNEFRVTRQLLFFLPESGRCAAEYRPAEEAAEAAIYWEKMRMFISFLCFVRSRLLLQPRPRELIFNLFINGIEITQDFFYVIQKNRLIHKMVSPVHEMTF
jgi:hypothetical protein